MEAQIIPSHGGTNPAMAYIGSLNAESSRYSQTQALRAIARLLGAGDPFSYPWHRLGYEHVAAIQSRLVQARTPGTARRYMCALRGVLRSAWRMNLMSSDDYQHAVDVRPIKGKTVSGRALDMDEVQALLNTCVKGGPTRGTRDASMILILVGCGLRRTEVCSLTLADYDSGTGRLLIHGKGNKQRYAYATHTVKTALDDWIRMRGLRPGPLFLVIVKGDQTINRSMSGTGLWRMLDERRKEAGVGNFQPHDLRRTYISDMLNLTDLATVSKLAGHESPLTTAKYDKRPEATVKEAAGLLHIPYEGRPEL